MARLKQATAQSKEVTRELERLALESDSATVMPRLRKVLANLNQSIHEYNAYENVLSTE